MNRKNLIVQGFPISVDPNVSPLFDPNKPYAGCLLCGEVFQSALDREVPPGHEPGNSLIAYLAFLRRTRWRKDHSLSHSSLERESLVKSQRFATPEAAQELSKYGMFSLIDLANDDEVSNALKEV